MKNTSESLMPIAGLDSSGNPVYTNRSKKVEADANLIASASEMKKALYDIIDFASDTMPSSCSVLRHDSPSYDPSVAKQYDLMKKIVDIANRAIIKAEGSE